MATVVEVIRGAEERLETARFGLEDMRTRPNRAQSGLRNAVVFGRTVTFALQNLRNIVSEFDAWYSVKQEELKTDPLMKYFSDLRTEIEKTVNRHTATSIHINSFLESDLQRFKPAPPGATSFFIGDQSGGSGWEVKRADGNIDKYYVDLQPDIGQVTVHLVTAPPEFRHFPAEKLVGLYLDRLHEVIVEAKAHFMPSK
jgi:hypothetical protein